jgi:integrase
LINYTAQIHRSSPCLFVSTTSGEFDVSASSFQKTTPSQEQRIYLVAAPQPLRDVATLVLECGCHPEEICRLKRENVNLEQNYLFIPSGKTKAARRRIPLTESAISVLQARMNSHGYEYLFPHRSN